MRSDMMQPSWRYGSRTERIELCESQHEPATRESPRCRTSVLGGAESPAKSLDEPSHKLERRLRYLAPA
jgi:hypothetical protein